MVRVRSEMAQWGRHVVTEECGLILNSLGRELVTCLELRWLWPRMENGLKEHRRSSRTSEFCLREIHIQGDSHLSLKGTWEFDR